MLWFALVFVFASGGQLTHIGVSNNTFESKEQCEKVIAEVALESAKPGEIYRPFCLPVPPVVDATPAVPKPRVLPKGSVDL